MVLKMLLRTAYPFGYSAGYALIAFTTISWTVAILFPLFGVTSASASLAGACFACKWIVDFFLFVGCVAGGVLTGVVWLVF